MKIKNIYNILTLIKTLVVGCYIPHGFKVIHQESNYLSNLIVDNNLPYHLSSSRIKTFQSTVYKLNNINHQFHENKNNNNNNNNNNKISGIYDLHDIIGFRYVFYNLEDLLKFYHYIKLDRTVTYTKNYIINPKENGYKSMHIRYLNPYKNICPLKQLECQLYIIDDYYNSLYGKSKYDKNYTIFF